MLRKIIALSLLLGFLYVRAHSQYAKGVTVETLLKTDVTSIGQPIIYPKVTRSEVSMTKITIAPGATTGWHKHQIPLFAYVIQGILTIMLENGDEKQFPAGSATAEVVNVYHQGINKGKEPVILLVCYLGGDAIPLSEGQQKKH